MTDPYKSVARINPPIHRGYIEGYYGHLLNWQERGHLITHLAALQCDGYLYAPKEDIYHRRQWRTLYNAEFLSDFSRFAHVAKTSGIRVLAGIAPGLDFDFRAPEGDTEHLFAKAEQLIHAGADAIVLMFDDISDDISSLTAAGLDEGECHAQLANALTTHFNCPVMLVPRLYADEISGNHTSYADALNQYLEPEIPVLLCGETIVAREVNLNGRAGIIGNQLQNPVILWDNLYCNDYCPRRLFLGAYQGRDKGDPILLNGTGMCYTDALLLSIMSGQSPEYALREAGVPEAINLLLPFFDLPVFSGQTLTPLEHRDITPLLGAIEILLWEWKSPLALEWYPYLFGLKHDLHIITNEMPLERLAKTQTPSLFAHLLKDPS